MKDNLRDVEARIDAACARAGRDRDSVMLIAVTKQQSIQRIKEAVAAGLTMFAENRLQDAKPKLAKLDGIGEWHFIGHLQFNKAKEVAELFDVIQSVDSLRLARALSTHGTARKKPVRIYVEVNISGEPQKFGFAITDQKQITSLQNFPGIRLEGLMGIAPKGPNESIRASFRTLHELRDNLRPTVGDLKLSMGMSQDFEIAIEEGADLIRIGTALFR